MVYKIKKGKQSASPRRFGLFFGKKRVAFYATFNHTNRYITDKNENQEDWNKLCGIGYLPHHHTDSARVGWRYNPSTDKIELSAYTYIKTKRVEEFLGSVEIGCKYFFEITNLKGAYSWTVLGVEQSNTDTLYVHTIPHGGRDKWLGYPLNFTFGGNEKSPHDMFIEIDVL